MQALETSVQTENSSANGKHNEGSKEFLRPTFEKANIKKEKKVRKGLKTCAQALGINEEEKQHDKNENLETDNGKKKRKEKRLKKSN